MTTMGSAAGETTVRGRTERSLGARLRELRMAAGLSQTALAADRFSKEYVSQIERGKTRPTQETIEWLAARLGVDTGYLVDGVAADERARLEAWLARAEVLAESEEFEEAARLFTEVQTTVATNGQIELEVRAICGAWRALVPLGRVREALEGLVRARSLAEGPHFSDIDRAEVLYRLGASRYLLQSNATALALLNEALQLAERSPLPSDLLRSNIFHWRSRCYRRQRDYEAAREDVERALELAASARDPKTLGHLYFQASILAERQGHWVQARNYAERAKALYEAVADRTNVGKLLNNLGGLHFLLGDPDAAVRRLKEAFATALEVGNTADAAVAVSSLAQVHLRTGDASLAEEQARHALTLLDDRIDYLHEIGSAQLVLGRALMEQDRLDEAETALRAAEASFDQLSSASHRASAWVARGDLASRRGDLRAAARLYRSAAEALQDVRF
jgi:tetratricopeptide (TPR) repeat protein